MPRRAGAGATILGRDGSNADGMTELAECPMRGRDGRGHRVEEGILVQNNSQEPVTKATPKK